jgi:HD-GYP domain-containing protein (c-di-GMP phosphodiesterase class II)
MSFVPLAQVRRHVRLDEALPFDVLDAQQRLLLARGYRLKDQAQMDMLIQRGALVTLAVAEALAAAAVAPPPQPAARPGPRSHAAIFELPRAALPGLWRECLNDVADALRMAPSSGLAPAIESASAPVLALVARDPDLAIYQVLARSGGPDAEYGARRSLQTAIACSLVAQRLHWSDADTERVFKAALTSNLSMLALQGELARQTDAPSASQRQALASHPMRSVQMLREAGVEDEAWLEAVLDHHECEDGSGYPSGRRDAGDLAGLIRRADLYTGKLASRNSRTAMAADMAGRAMFMAEPGHPMTAALIKEFGLYPPGCMVRLGNGAIGVVVERGESITAPIVAVLSGQDGKALPRPTRIAAAAPGWQVQGIVGESGTAASSARLDKLATLVFE